MRWRRWASILAGAVVIGAVATGVRAKSIAVGGKNFTEQLLMAEMTRQLLRSQGFTVDLRAGFATGAIRQAQEAGQIDVYWEYTGTALTEFNKVADKLDPDAAYARVRALDAARGLVWLNPSRVDNTYALAMRRADALARSIASISDLAAKVNAGETFKLVTNPEFLTRSDGLIPLQQAYGFALSGRDVVRLDTDLVYPVLRDSKAIDVGLVFATDGRIPAFDFVLLRDDKGFFPDYRLTPVVRRTTLDDHPELARHLNALSAELDNATMAKLNAMVDIDKQTAEEVAAVFLKARGLV